MIYGAPPGTTAESKRHNLFNILVGLSRVRLSCRLVRYGTPPNLPPCSMSATSTWSRSNAASTPPPRPGGHVIAGVDEIDRGHEQRRHPRGLESAQAQRLRHIRRFRESAARCAASALGTGRGGTFDTRSPPRVPRFLPAPGVEQRNLHRPRDIESDFLRRVPQ